MVTTNGITKRIVMISLLRKGIKGLIPNNAENNPEMTMLRESSGES